MVDTSISPYFDDYNEIKNFYKVLFNPKRAVQVRELNQLQSILQNQVSSFADNIFSNGSMVIPGEINYNFSYEYVTVSGVDYSSILDTLTTNTVTLEGVTSGITATIVQYVGNTVTDPITFYIQYSQGSNGDTPVRFVDGESIQLKVGSTVFNNATVVGTGQGSVFTVQAGIFYLNGNFIRTDTQKVILGKYSNTPTAVVGFRLTEEIVDWTVDNSLLDNASGTTNYNAPGADRLKRVLTLEVNDPSSSYDKENYIELAKFESGVLQSKVKGPDYSVLEDTLARRTYDESGDYTVSPFGIRVREHLNDGTNDGLYTAGNGGDESKFVVGVEQGKAYVKGYEVENLATQYIPVDKARDNGTINNASFTAPVGNYIEVSNMNVLPKSDTFSEISFYSGTPASPGSIPSGTVVGTARVRYTEYDFVNSKGHLYLFEIKNAAGDSDSSFINSAGSVYSAGSPAFTGELSSAELLDSINYQMIYQLPIDNVKSLLNAGVSDTSFSVIRQYEVAADSGGTVVLTAGSNETFATPTDNNSVASYVDVSSTPQIVSIAGISTIGGVPTGKTLTIALGASAASKTITINTEVIKEVASIKTKTKSSITVNFTSSGDFDGDILHLGKADVISITSVVEDTTDRTFAYTLNQNKTPEVYGESFITLDSATYGSATAYPIHVTFEYFVHGTGDFFCVDSYSGIDYKEIPTEEINNQSVSLADVIDFRPRYSDDGTGFSGTGSSICEPPAPFTLIRADIEHYLPRIDKVFVNSKGTFNVIKGVSNLSPKEPKTPDNAMALYKLHLPAYVKSVKDIVIEFINNKRYTMRDIGNLDSRISNLEYYISLNLLEQETNATQIIDSGTGLNRFKNGFIADSFVDNSIGLVTSPDYKCSIYPTEGILRPQFNFDQSLFDFISGSSSNVTLTGSLITLPYTETNLISQSLASSSINVNPYSSFFWGGNVRLNPNSDSWFDTVYTDPDVTNKTFTSNLSFLWLSWDANWYGTTTFYSQTTNGNITTTTRVSEKVVDDKIVDQSVIPYMRRKDINFYAKGLLPLTRFYAFFDNVDVSSYCYQIGKSLGQPMISDASGNLSGVFKLPNDDYTKFRTGTKLFTLIENVDDDKSTSVSYGDATYTAEGTILTRTQSIVSTKYITITRSYEDPLAQSFLIKKDGGVFVTSVDLFFSSKDENIPVSIEIRNMVNGFPGNEVVPYSQKVVEAADINISSDASVSTKFTFDSPVYLVDEQEYCFIVKSNSNQYRAFIATLGEKQVNSNIYISKQPYAGTLFKSQNTSTWTPDQMSDLKFNINIADFNTSVTGNAVFNNGDLPTITLSNNPITSVSGSNVLTVKFKNHGLFTGSKVTIDGIATAPAIPVGEINTTHSVYEVVDIDSFKIQTTTNADESTSFGGASVTSTFNLLMDTIKPIADELIFENTNLQWSFVGTSGKSIDGTETPYQTMDSINLSANSNYDLSQPFVILSADEETDKLAGNKSGTLNAILTSSVSNISPAIDINGLGLLGVNNRINDPTSLTENLVSDGNASAKYLTAITGLKTSADSLKVYFDANKPSGSDIIVMYRIGNSIEEVKNKSWSTLPSIITTAATDQFTFTEFEYGEDSLSLYSFYQIKIVMLSSSTSNVPKIKRFRGIALS